MKERLNQLDGLKVLLSFGIVLFHYSAMFNHELSKLPYADFPQIANIIKRGNFGVEIFFVISGFLLAYSSKDKIKKLSFIYFFKNKFKILFISAFLSVLLGILAKLLSTCLLGWNNSFNLWNILLSLTFTSQGWVQTIWPYGMTTWYIGVLVLCYIIYFIISRISSSKPNMYIPLCIIMVFIGYICIYKQFNFPFLYYNTGRGYCCFFLGILINEFQDAKNINKTIISYITFFITLFFTLLSFILGVDKSFGPFYLVMPMFVAPTIVLSILNIKWLKQIFSIKPFNVLSKINTSLFLTHSSVMSIIWTLNLHFKLGFASNNLFYWCANIIIDYIIAIIWYCLIEKRLVPRISTYIKSIIFGPSK